MAFQQRRIAAGIACALGLTAGAAAFPAAAQDVRVEVTGSNIRRVDTESPAPVQVITREEIERSGAQTVNEVIRLIPANQAVAYDDTFISGFSVGSAGVSLRGLGQRSTLVLINGRRMVNYGFAQNLQDTFVDLNSIPLAAIERIDVLLDGASAIYGSDAIAGVINIILRKDYTGAEISGTLGYASTIEAPEYRANATLGFGDLAKDKYNGFVTFDYYKRDEATWADHPMFADADFRRFGGGTLERSSTAGTHVRLSGPPLPGNTQAFATCADEVRQGANGATTCVYNPNGDRRTLSAQVKKGLARAFAKFDEYQLAKYAGARREVKLRDVLFLCHAKPRDEALFQRLANRQLATPDTWEVGLSAAKTPQEKRMVWERLIESRKLGALAFLKNLRNMQEAETPRSVIAQGFAQLQPGMLLPIDFLRAARVAPTWTKELEALMLQCAAEFPKLPGWTIFVVDVSGSMGAWLSARSRFTRLDAAAAMAILAREMCERVTVYATAGSDSARKHATRRIDAPRGFALAETISEAARTLGGGGIFTRQCLEAIRHNERGDAPDRIVIFSDSQDCDHPTQRIPQPFGWRNYIVDVSSHTHGVNYEGAWTAEISGWSENFLRFIAEVEQDAP